MNCTRAGCTGVIEDGYCNTCWFAPVTEGHSEPPPSASQRLGVDYGGSSISPSAVPATSPPETSGTSGTSGTAASTVGTAGIGSGVASTSARTGGTRTTRRGTFGAGLVEVPSVPPRDPATVVLTNPEVPENRRFCGTCGKPVGRGRDGHPGRAEGFGPECGHPFSFTPKLHPGDLVAGQYDIAGCIAHGGLGWIYLAQDRKVSDRWVVLKGLLDSGDESAMAAAIAERRFLAEVKHPNIVTIHNFTEHDGAGYIVMEYVGGSSLKELRQQAATGAEPMTVAQAIAYILAILPAFEYLHARDLMFCDFKPDNVIQTEDQVKLIDLGGVHRLDDDESDLYGTIGYQAPEVPVTGPTVASDLYTVARTLAVLSFDFHGCQDPKRYATSLPPATDVAVFQRYPSFHRFLLRATATDPDARFQSAADMAEQLVGVLRQVVTIDGGHPPSVASEQFTGDLLTEVDFPSWRDLPVPRVDPADPGAATLANLSTSQPEQLVEGLEQAEPSAEIRFRLARARLELDDLDGADRALAEQEAAEGHDWRSTWWRAIWQLAGGEFDAARRGFTELTQVFPGELAPLLGRAAAADLAAAELAAAAEAAPDTDTTSMGTDARPELLHVAARDYELVSATDASYTTAAFGLARVRASLGDRHGAADALERVPSTSIHFTRAAVARCQVLSVDLGDDVATRDDLVEASATLARLDRGPVQTGLTRDLLTSALALLEDGTPADPATVIAGCAFTDDDVRLGLERACRSLARSAPSPGERIELIDEANQHRPRSLV